MIFDEITSRKKATSKCSNTPYPFTFLVCKPVNFFSPEIHGENKLNSTKPTMSTTATSLTKDLQGTYSHKSASPPHTSTGTVNELKATRCRCQYKIGRQSPRSGTCYYTRRELSADSAPIQDAMRGSEVIEKTYHTALISEKICINGWSHVNL